MCKKYLIKNIAVCFFISLFLACCSLLFIGLGDNLTKIASATKIDNTANGMFADKTEEECLEFVCENGVTIPNDYINNPNLPGLVKGIILQVENNPNVQFFYNYWVAQEFAEDIKSVVLNYYNIYSAPAITYSSSLLETTLPNNSQYGIWHDDYRYYNCYSYAINYLEGTYGAALYRKPGDISEGDFNINLPISTMANMVKDDLLAIGYEDVYVTNVRPSILNANQKLICIRKSDMDFHFMKYHPYGDFWTHKPGASAVLKYNHQPSNDVVWLKEEINYRGDVTVSEDDPYDSEIYYIYYDWCDFYIENDTLIGMELVVDFDTHVDLPLVSAIGDYAFQNQTQIQSVTIPNTVTSIGAGAFSGCDRLTTVTISDSVTSIGANAFAGCTHLSNCTLPIGLSVISNGVFSGCTWLHRINIPNEVTSIGANAFAGCTSLTSITIPASVTNIGSNAFERCHNIQNIHIYGSVNIDNNVFANCTYLSNVYFYSYTAPTIEDGAFPSGSFDLYVPHSKQCEYSAVFSEYDCEITSLQITVQLNVEGEIVQTLNTYFGAVIDCTTPEFEDFTFSHWLDEYGREYYESGVWDTTESITVVAIWVEPYVIQIDLGYENRTSEIELHYNEIVSFNSMPSNRNHYELRGYYSQPNGSGTCYATTVVKPSGEYQFLEISNEGNPFKQFGNGIIYAHWQLMEMDYSIPVQVMGVGYLTPRVEHLVSGEVKTLNANVPSGYTLYYWTINGENFTTEQVTYTFELHRSIYTGEITIYTNNYPGSSTDGGITLFLQQNAAPPTEDSCVAAGTLITLADGRQVPVETLTGNEMLLVWNLHTGSFDVAPILFIDSDALANYKIINLYFSDGTHVKVIDEHAFWDFNLNKYVYLREDASQYIGHWFNKQITDTNGNMAWARVQLTNVTITEEMTTAWSPVTYGHLCLYVNGMLSMPGGIEGLVNTFEVDGNTMRINQAQYLADITTYGLFTYEEFAEICPVPENIFNAVQGQYLKVAIGKGYIDYETLGVLIETYSEFF